MIHIERASLSDFEAAFGLIERFFREEGFHTPSATLRANLQTRMDDPLAAVFIAWEGEGAARQAVGVETVAAADDLEHTRYAEIEDLYIVPEKRGQGVAKAMIAAAREWCIAQGCTTIYITVTPEGQQAHNLIAFYERLGFQDTGRVVLREYLTPLNPSE